MHSLRFKIAAITALAIVASFATFFGLSLLTIGGNVERESVEKMHLLSENARQSLDDSLDSIAQSVEMSARLATDSLDGVTLVECGFDKEPQDRTPEQAKRLDVYLRDRSAQIRNSTRSFADYTKDVVSFVYCVSPDIGDPDLGFFYTRIGKAGFEERTSPDARKLDPADKEHNAWYFTPIERGGPSWVGPYKSRPLDDALFESYFTPIYKAGTFIGVLGMGVPLETLISKIRSIDVYETGFACLLDAQGNILYHPSMEANATTDFLTHEIMDTFANERDSGDHLLRYQKNGELWQLSFSTLSNGMRLAVCAPVGEITESWRHLSTSVAFVAALFLMLFIPGALIAMREVSKPLQRLSFAAQELAAGDYDVELDYEGQDEVGVLTASFKRMRDDLRAYISDLNSRAYVDALTHVKNQGSFELYSDRLNDAIRDMASNDEPLFALVMFDCNKLKDINDQYGHECGDVYLQTASRLICQIYDHSPVFRVGGDEFVVLLQDRDYENREQLLAEFDSSKDEINARTSNRWQQVDIAKGMATYRCGEDSTVEEVLRRADVRMYEDKRRGSGTVR